MGWSSIYTCVSKVNKSKNPIPSSISSYAGFQYVKVAVSYIFANDQASHDQYCHPSCRLFLTAVFYYICLEYYRNKLILLNKFKAACRLPFDCPSCEVYVYIWLYVEFVTWIYVCFHHDVQGCKLIKIQIYPSLSIPTHHLKTNIFIAILPFGIFYLSIPLGIVWDMHGFHEEKGTGEDNF